MTYYIPNCMTCRHYKPESDSCPAFPAGIPPELFADRKFKHTKAVPGQTGDTLYEEKK